MTDLKGPQGPKPESREDSQSPRQTEPGIVVAWGFALAIIVFLALTLAKIAMVWFA